MLFLNLVCLTVALAWHRWVVDVPLLLDGRISEPEERKRKEKVARYSVYEAIIAN
jgi:hypothetical protein